MKILKKIFGTASEWRQFTFSIISLFIGIWISDIYHQNELDESISSKFWKISDGKTPVNIKIDEDRKVTWEYGGSVHHEFIGNLNNGVVKGDMTRTNRSNGNRCLYRINMTSIDSNHIFVSYMPEQDGICEISYPYLEVWSSP